ncbi:hypothetical protein FB451DRAFT_1372124 [Mycena latifolia]|nr:hypothetical protein FB451DRAFT_1372124 [Mycena latifolia]
MGAVLWSTLPAFVRGLRQRSSHSPSGGPQVGVVHGSWWWKHFGLLRCLQQQGGPATLPPPKRWWCPGEERHAVPRGRDYQARPAILRDEHKCHAVEVMVTGKDITNGRSAKEAKQRALRASPKGADGGDGQSALESRDPECTALCPEEDPRGSGVKLRIRQGKARYQEEALGDRQGELPRQANLSIDVVVSSGGDIQLDVRILDDFIKPQAKRCSFLAAVFYEQIHPMRQVGNPHRGIRPIELFMCSVAQGRGTKTAINSELYSRLPMAFEIPQSSDRFKPRTKR